jgi:transaldolase
MAFHANRTTKSALPIDQKIINEHFMKLSNAGVDFEAVLDKQISDGLEAFKDAFKEILESL